MKRKYTDIFIIRDRYDKKENRTSTVVKFYKVIYLSEEDDFLVCDSKGRIEDCPKHLLDNVIEVIDKVTRQKLKCKVYEQTRLRKTTGCKCIIRFILAKKKTYKSDEE
jgi:hypothetical protein